MGGGILAGIAFPLAFWITYFRIVSYPLDLAIACITYFLRRWQPHSLARLWTWYPINWNEVVWLPLPFAGKFLALLVHQNREEGFRQIAFVAAERKLQRRAARLALVDVAIDDLHSNSVAELAAVAEKLRWTTDAPAELPAGLIAALPRFDRVAQHADQYLVLQGPYRRGEALKRALEEVGHLQRSLIAAQGNVAPRLLQMAIEWQELLDAERARLRAQGDMQPQIPNPFVFGNPVSEQHASVFTGRRDIVRQVEDSLLSARQAPTLLLHGARRMGKTSILNQLPRLLGPDFGPGLLDCQNPAVTESPATLLRYMSRTISTGLQRRRVRAEPLTRESLERESFAVFDDWLDRAERTMPDKMRILLCLDEYERLQSILDAGWGAKFLDALRHTIQHRTKVDLIFAGAHTFEEMGTAWTNRFLSARRVRVSFLTPDELRPLLIKPIPEFDLRYAPGALEALMDVANGQPSLTQAVAFELVQFLNVEQRKEAAVVDVEVAIGRALVSASEYFAEVWADAGAEGQAILRALIQGKTAPDFPTARSWLRQHDVLNDAGTFAVPLVQRWVKQKIG